MNKIIPFNKDIKFQDKIGEITSIALDDNLSFKDSYTISGELIVRGCHKYEELEEDFSYTLPTHITVDQKYDTSKAKVMVDDFYYEILNDDILKVKIDLILDDLYFKEEKLEPLREEVIPVEVNDDEILEISKNDSIEDGNNYQVSDLFKDNNDKKEYTVYRVYVLTNDDTIDKVLEKYKITIEELSHYNDLDNIKPGMKLIIPSIDE